MIHTTWNTKQIMPQGKSLLPAWMRPELAHAEPPAVQGLAAATEGFMPISLREMDSVALLDRTDTKFVLTTADLVRVLPALRDDYRILTVGGQSLNHYRTLYFDTPCFDLYHLHVNGHADRYKVRSREYIDTQRSFFEVKHKNNKGRTVKERIATDQPVMGITWQTVDWLHNVFPYDSRALEAKIWNTFTRITLVSKQLCERVTLDVDLAFYRDDQTARLDEVAIAEVKLSSRGEHSPFLAQMHAHRIQPRGFSKYCIGVSLLYDKVKKNAMKPKMLWIMKMVAGDQHDGVR